MGNRKWYFTFSLGVILLFLLPYILAYHFTPSGMVFTGFVLDSVDNQTYISKMRAAQYGWHFINNYSAYDTYGGYIFLLYILLGKIALLFHIPFVIMYHLGRVVAGVFLLWSLSKFIDSFSLPERAKKLAFVLTAIGGANEYYISFMNWLKNMPVLRTPYMPEITPSTAMLYTPHFILVMAFQLQVWRLAKGYLDHELHIGVKIGIWLLLIALIHPHIAVLTGISLAVYILGQMHEARKLRIRRILPISLFGLIPLPYLGYALYAFTTLPALVSWQNQAERSLPPFYVTMVYWGAPFVITCYLLLKKWSWQGERRMLSWWILSSGWLSLLPLATAWRYLEGLGVPAFILLGFWLYDKLPDKVVLRTLAVGFLSINTVWWCLEPAIIDGINPVSYITTEQNEALTWLKANASENSVVFSDRMNGNLIPGMTGVRVVLGHKDESAKYKDFLNEWQQLLADNGSSAYPLLKKLKVDYVFMDNKQFGKRNLVPELYAPVYVNDQIKVYKVL